MAQDILKAGFETRPMAMEPLWQVAYQAPQEDADRIFDEITQAVPLKHGKTDRNAYQARGGVEIYRPLEGTPTGAEDEVRHRPNVDEVRFFIPRDTAVLDQVIEAIYEVSSYYEPVITVQDVLRSTCKGLDDKNNPHRWWNKSGDWKTSDD